MSRKAGQVTPLQAVAGGLAVMLVVAGVVAGAHALLRPVERAPALPSAAPSQARPPCPAARETLPRPASAALTSDPVAVTSEELIECPTAFDGRRVVIVGEVVRAVLRRSDRAWVQLNDDRYALEAGPLPAHGMTMGANAGIAVSLPAADAERIEFVGDARARGDRLQVEGTFLRADPADGGGPAIEADAVEVVAVGQPLSRPVTPLRAVVAVLLAVAAGAMTRTARRSQRR